MLSVIHDHVTISPKRHQLSSSSSYATSSAYSWANTNEVFKISKSVNICTVLAVDTAAFKSNSMIFPIIKTVARAPSHLRVAAALYLTSPNRLLFAIRHWHYYYCLPCMTSSMDLSVCSSSTDCSLFSSTLGHAINTQFSVRCSDIARCSFRWDNLVPVRWMHAEFTAAKCWNQKTQQKIQVHKIDRTREIDVYLKLEHLQVVCREREIDR